MIKLFISKSKYLVTELYENGVKTNLRLADLEIPKKFFINKRDERSPSIDLFIYRGEEEDSKKELCIIFKINRDFNIRTTDPKQFQDVTVTCYQYKTWNITKGPFSVPALS
jgi:hypothetical protein